MPLNRNYLAMYSHEYRVWAMGAFSPATLNGQASDLQIE